MNRHGTAITLGAFGFLIEGPSGSGKTALAIAAINEWTAQGQFAALIVDDQCLIEVANDRLIATCPPALADLVEMRGLGVVPHKTFSPAIIDCVIRLVDASQIERLPQPKTTTIAGIGLPLFELPERQITVSLPLLYQIAENRRV